MPRAPRICTQPGCPRQATQAGRCPDHTPKPWASKRSDLPGTSRSWRAAVLANDNHTCRRCGQPATEADHIIARHIAPELANDPDNGQALCGRCHREKSQSEAAAARWPQDQTLGG